MLVNKHLHNKYSSVPTQKYIVRPGDTIFGIVRHHGVNLNTLMITNPHIIYPTLIKPGDILNIPKHNTAQNSNISSNSIALPKSNTSSNSAKASNIIKLTPKIDLPSWTNGIGIINDNPISTSNIKSLILIATLPDPKEFGYDNYLSFIEISNNEDYSAVGGKSLYKTPENPPTWTYRYDSFPIATNNTIKISVGAQKKENPVVPGGDLVIFEGFI